MTSVQIQYFLAVAENEELYVSQFFRYSWSDLAACSCSWAHPPTSRFPLQHSIGEERTSRPRMILDRDKKYRVEAGLPEEGLTKSAAELMGEK